MRLAEFITGNMERILEDWVAFAAASGPAGGAMSLADLRDHGQQMLQVIVRDLNTPQTDTEQTEKSKGKAAPAPDTGDTAAETHGARRAQSGFTLVEMVSEYRALRASVIRLWTKECGRLEGADLEDLTRFNEAIDQSLAESTARFTEDLDHSKEMFVAILGHDLRNPLNAIVMSAQFLLELDAGRQPNAELAGRILSSARRMNAMVGDLLDFTRSRLGEGVPVARSECDLGRVARDAVEEISAAHPGREIVLRTDGDLTGMWDAARLAQVVTNLLSNAVQYGATNTPITIEVLGQASDVAVVVHNRGPQIPADSIAGLFSPLKRISSRQGTDRPSDNLGLGLYIAERIVTAHGGSIDVASSTDRGTTFTVRLPRVLPVSAPESGS